MLRDAAPVFHKFAESPETESPIAKNAHFSRPPITFAWNVIDPVLIEEPT
jgi:hypothetical protein